MTTTPHYNALHRFLPDACCVVLPTGTFLSPFPLFLNTQTNPNLPFTTAYNSQFTIHNSQLLSLSTLLKLPYSVSLCTASTPQDSKLPIPSSSLTSNTSSPQQANTLKCLLFLLLTLPHLPHPQHAPRSRAKSLMHLQTRTTQSSPSALTTIS